MFYFLFAQHFIRTMLKLIRRRSYGERICWLKVIAAWSMTFLCKLYNFFLSKLWMLKVEKFLMAIHVRSIKSRDLKLASRQWINWNGSMTWYSNIAKPTAINKYSPRCIRSNNRKNAKLTQQNPICIFYHAERNRAAWIRNQMKKSFIRFICWRWIAILSG